MLKVAVITPTTHERSEFNHRIKQIFDYQDYENKVHLFDYSDAPIGTKRNRMCSITDADIIVCCDSDDIYSPSWISKCVAALDGVDMVGLQSCYFHDVFNDDVYCYTNNNPQVYFPEATLAFWRKTWERNPFTDTNEGEGMKFVANGGTKRDLCYNLGFLATIHGANTCSHDAIRYMKKIAPDEAIFIIDKAYGR